MIDHVRQHMQGHVKHRVWLFLDLQQSVPAEANYCLSTAVNDFKKLNLACDDIWYLGDAMEGANKEQFQEMTDIQLNLLKPLNIPVRFVLGNHDFDYVWAYRNKNQDLPIFFHKAVAQTPGWKTADHLSDFCFAEDMGDYIIVFLSDHGDPGGAWIPAMKLNVRISKITIIRHKNIEHDK